MNITFVLPGPMQQPMGGYLVVFEYADRLAGKGHQVTVLFSLHLPYVNLIKQPKLLLDREAQKPYSPEWFSFKNQVTLKTIPEISNRYVPNGDAIFATFWATAISINKLEKTKGMKYYFIQGYDYIWYNKFLLHGTYKFGFKNIVISKWLEEKLLGVGAPVTAYIPNGIDFRTFHITKSIETRNSFSVAMIYKVSANGFEAIKLVKEKHPELKVTVFSVFSRPEWLPDWVSFIYRPTHKELADIYNNHAIFISSSRLEGFGLPGAESLACGCALITTDSGGVREYAFHNKTALLSPYDVPNIMADNICRLINDINFRIMLAQNGNKYIQNYNWENSLDKMEQLLLNG